MRKTRSKTTYDHAFREDALAYLDRSQGTFAAVAASLGIPKHTLYTWYKSDMATKAKKGLGSRKPRVNRRCSLPQPRGDSTGLLRLAKTPAEFALEFFEYVE